MQNSLPLIIESRIHGDMYVRFGGRHFETYHRKVERRMMPSLLPYVVKLVYAIAGVVAVVGAISVYIKMNNEEQDVKNILVLQNRQETRRKEMKLNSLLHNTLWRYFNFPIFENVLLKNI
jgi:hypothetical protein